MRSVLGSLAAYKSRNMASMWVALVCLDEIPLPAGNEIAGARIVSMKTFWLTAFAGWFGLLVSACEAAEVTAEMLDRVETGMSRAQVADLLKVPLETKSNCTFLDLGKSYDVAKVCIEPKDLDLVYSDRVDLVYSVERFPPSTDPYQLFDKALKQEEAKRGPPDRITEWKLDPSKTAQWGKTLGNIVLIVVKFSGSFSDNDVRIERTEAGLYAPKLHKRRL